MNCTQDHYIVIWAVLVDLRCFVSRFRWLMRLQRRNRLQKRICRILSRNSAQLRIKQNERNLYAKFGQKPSINLNAVGILLPIQILRYNFCCYNK